ncbi:MAG: peptidoglycan-binding protein [Acidobacteria bacterium]|nr:MAG: peptidoglycan-binding protein [Acidobacteriota bacterium]
MCALALGQTSDTSAASAKSKSSTKKSASSQTTKSSTHKRRKTRKASWRRGQQKADPQRAREIQEALIREHYLKGTPSGRWDDATQSAMQRYQAANGWQTKTVPDARALIKLGLGPSHDHLLNPESAMTTAPQPRSANSAPTDSSHSPAQQK